MRGKWWDEEGPGEGAGIRCCRRCEHQLGPIEAWIIDDTGFPKKGRHSVGVARTILRRAWQTGQLCQVAVTLSIANHDASLPMSLSAICILPKEWVSDRKRRRKVGVPDEISFKTEPEIALAQNPFGVRGRTTHAGRC